MGFVSITSEQAEKLGIQMPDLPKLKKSKFNNKHTKCTIGHMHRSIAEANYCCNLSLMLRAGRIKSFEVEVPYLLMKGFKYKSERIRDMKYFADFVVQRLDGKTEIVDTKGVRTAVFNMKWKLMKKKFVRNESVILTLA